MATSLSERQLQELDRRLRERHGELRDLVRDELLRSDAHDYSSLAGRVHDPGEESIADLLVDVNLEMIRKHKDELRDVEAALQRLETGTYGQCGDCGGDIDYPRLQVSPAARRCIDCQRRFEQNYGSGGTPTL